MIEGFFANFHPSAAMILLAAAFIFIALGLVAGSLDGRATLPIWVIAGIAFIAAAIFWAHSKGLLSGMEKTENFLQDLEQGIKDSHVDNTYF